MASSMYVGRTRARTRGGGVKQRGGRGNRGNRGNVGGTGFSKVSHVGYAARAGYSDVWSDCTSNTGIDSMDGDQEDCDELYTAVQGKQKKRRRQNTGNMNNAGLGDTNFASEQLSKIYSKLSSIEIKVNDMDKKVCDAAEISTRLNVVENDIRDQEQRLKLLEYKSIDMEARERRKNLIFRGLREVDTENCFNMIRDFLYYQLEIDDDMYLERAHRLGRKAYGKDRPVIVAFRDFIDTDNIMQNAYKLKNTSYGINRDYPNEIVKARKSLWGL